MLFSAKNLPFEFIDVTFHFFSAIFVNFVPERFVEMIINKIILMIEISKIGFVFGSEVCVGVMLLTV